MSHRRGGGHKSAQKVSRIIWMAHYSSNCLLSVNLKRTVFKVSDSWSSKFNKSVNQVKYCSFNICKSNLIGSKMMVSSMLRTEIGLITVTQGFSNFFGWRPLNLSEKSRDPQGILRPSKCEKYHVKTLIFAMFYAMQVNFFFVSNLATLFWQLATLKRFATPSLRTTAVTNSKSYVSFYNLGLHWVSYDE